MYYIFQRRLQDIIMKVMPDQRIDDEWPCDASGEGCRLVPRCRPRNLHLLCRVHQDLGQQADSNALVQRHFVERITEYG